MTTTTATDYKALYQEADAAGKQAAENCNPTPMFIKDSRATIHVVESGVCGFAWVVFKGTTGFARWAKKAGLATPAYGGGLQVWISGYHQSMQRKEAYAQAFAGVLTAAGVAAYPRSRMD